MVSLLQIAKATSAALIDEIDPSILKK